MVSIKDVAETPQEPEIPELSEMTPVLEESPSTSSGTASGGVPALPSMNFEDGGSSSDEDTDVTESAKRIKLENQFQIN